MNIIEEVLVENIFDPMPCKVHECGEPFADFDSKLCVEHYTEMIEGQQLKVGIDK